MTITVTNSGPITIDEYAGLSGTFTVSDSLAGTETVPLNGIFIEQPKIVKVTASHAFLPGLTMSITGDNTVEYSGSFDDVFERHWKYVLADNTRGDVPKASQLPAEYLALYAFVPPSVTSIPITFSFYAWTHDTDGLTSNNPDAYTGKSLYAALPGNLSTITAPQMTLVGTSVITVTYNVSSDRVAFQAALPAGTLYQQALAKGLV